MRGYFSTGQISEDEKQNILNQHRELYNGYQSLHPKVNNEQPLFVQDFANDKVGAVVNNKGVVKPYTNMGINEGILDDYEQEIGTDEVDQEAFDNSEVTEGGECLECGSGYMEEDEENLPDSNLFEGAECSECGGIMMEGECMECGWKGDMNEEDECLDCDDDMMEGKGKLSDIYSVEDLNPEAGFDYIEGSSNDEDTFEGMHKSLYEEEEELDELGTDELSKGKKYKFKSPSYEDEIEYDDEFEDKFGGEKMYKFKGKSAGHLMPGKHIEDYVSKIDEIGFTGGGNAPDMDISNIDPAFDFESEGPEMGDGPFDIEADDMDLDKNKEWKAFDFKSDGPSDGGEAYPTFEEKEYEVMESAFADLDEVDISGSQGIYGDMKPAYDFDSDGPGSAGPYQRRNEGETQEHYLPTDVWDDAHKKGHVKTHKELGIKSDDDFDEDELEVDFDEFDPRDKSWEEITTYTGEDEFGSVDEEIKESLIVQRNKIVEMFERMKRF